MKNKIKCPMCQGEEFETVKPVGFSVVLYKTKNQGIFNGGTHASYKKCTNCSFMALFGKK